MTLYNVISCIPGKRTVTIEDYVTHEIFFANETVWNVIHQHDQLFHKFGLKNFVVYKIDKGTDHVDLIISVLQEEKEI